MNPPWSNTLPDYAIGGLGYVLVAAEVQGVSGGVIEFNTTSSGVIRMRTVFVDNQFVTMDENGMVTLVTDVPSGYSTHVREMAGYSSEVPIETHSNLSSFDRTMVTWVIR